MNTTEQKIYNYFKSHPNKEIRGTTLADKIEISRPRLAGIMKKLRRDPRIKARKNFIVFYYTYIGDKK